jgi:hypothetical protein
LLEYTRCRRHGWPVLLSLVVAMGTGCADDNAVTTEGPMGTSTGADTTDTTPPGTTGSTTAVADETGTGTSTGDPTTTGDTTGGDAVAGQSMSQLVSAGERASNGNFTLVYTFGQPTSLQSTHQSANFRLHGGLSGANGSPP